MHDPKVSEVANDSSTETMTIKLTGLGQYASFYIDGVQISSSQITVDVNWIKYDLYHYRFNPKQYR